MNKTKSIFCITITSLVSAVSPYVQSETEDNETFVERISIIGDQKNLRLSAGAVSIIDKDELELFEYDDIARILAQVPGVNVRLEDGYGLRPNIGFRGVTPERSKKINIMEDGLLIGPAPYSAPAAYFFPLTSKLVGVEVTKGPAAIKYGPNTVAGAINLITRSVPASNQGQIDISAGDDGHQKAHAYYGYRVNESLGILVEGITLRSDGFQELVDDGDVGFKKNDYNIKIDYDFEANGLVHQLVFKGNYADEVSHFTYTGLTDDDFRSTPYLRYAGGQIDRMDWDHSAFSLSHFVESDTWSLSTQIYRTDLDRAWNKLNKFVSSFGDRVPSLLSIVSNPTNDINANLLSVLRGETDSTARELLEIGNNDRTLYSQGVQTDGEYQWIAGELAHQIEFGIRFHQDEIQRNHTVENFFMISGSLAPSGEGSRPTTTNTETTDAISLYLQDTIEWGDFIITAGIRYENIDGEYVNRAVGGENDGQSKTDDVLLPRLSMLYQLSDVAVIFAGVHRGFVPTSPIQDESIDFEKSVNYELGYRYSSEDATFESIAFFNDYSNLIESCSFSAGCDTDIAFSGGDVDVYGLELSAGTLFSLDSGLDIPIDFVYTYTDSEFKESFFSPFSLWNFVEEGNPLPYLANHQAAVSIGLEGGRWGIKSNIVYNGDMPESGQTALTGSLLDNPLTGVSTDSFTVVDLSAYYDVSEVLRGYFKIDNVFDDASIVSRRPYGARPNRPRQFQLGLKYDF
ncbi:MAG: TonB-dependent receptor [Pseudomonadota bacterium]